MASVPQKLLHEGEGHPITVEMKNGEIYRGQLVASEDNMNCQLNGVTVFAKDGQASKLEHVYLRGSQIRFVVLPDLLKNAPMFKKLQQMKEAKEKAQKAKPKTGPPSACGLLLASPCFQCCNAFLVIFSNFSWHLQGEGQRSGTCSTPKRSAFVN